MNTNIKKIPKSQLISYFREYREAFPLWDVEHDVVLVRSIGPVKQCIAFEALRSGAYRPSCCVHVLTALNCQLLFRFLDIKHRQVQPREHSAVRSSVLQAMEQQFLPPIRDTLDVNVVLHLAEAEVLADKIERSNASVALAALHAHVGNLNRAEWWCRRVPNQLAELGRELACWEHLHARYAKQLCEAIQQGRVESFLRSNMSS